MGLFFKKTKPSEELVENGIRGRATVEHSEILRGGMELRVSRRKTDALLSGEETPFREKVRLRIEVPGREVYTVETTVAVPMMKVSWVSAGSTLEVLVDPDHPERIAIDWAGQHQRGTAEQAIMDSPYAVKAIEGMGLDPLEVARKADEARRKALGEQQ
jgi:hypothetical protein